MEALRAAACLRLAAGQGELDLGLEVAGSAGAPLPIVASRMGYLWDVLCRAYYAVGLATATGGDPVFRALVLARIIEPTSKLDAQRSSKRPGRRGVLQPPSSLSCAGMPPLSGGSGWPRRARPTLGWDQSA
ncbi:hypothetical protein BL253_34640 [Pseudofrankia asymbiotica]|uniref:Uncharacterized protein n=1 Tax=Pseudofrankia asymbiotica TaxID=1834516 RepID=A0A1V2I0R5_9ACTN|nr:hypothetical protein [Pseudofrankia asymbiotica]ONH22846.1 hypothetical protein BL253_34640 [Pseudofrankia asymbiotica]